MEIEQQKSDMRRQITNKIVEIVRKEELAAKKQLDDEEMQQIQLDNPFGEEFGLDGENLQSIGVEEPV